jgi:uncharacterized Zn finger protein (UPF0148 family)
MYDDYDDTDEDIENENDETNNDDNNYTINYEDITTEYLNNVREIRRTLRHTLEYHNTFMSTLQRQVDILNRHTLDLHRLMMSNPQLDERHIFTMSNPRLNERINIQRNGNNTREGENTNNTTIPRRRRIFTRPYTYYDNILRAFYTNNNTINTQNQRMTDVVVSPSPQQINNACSTIRYENIEGANRYYERCPITYLVFENDTEVLRINHCGHYFDREGLMGWFRNSVVCPICRHDIRENNNTTNNTRNNNENINNNSNVDNVVNTNTADTSNANINNSNNNSNQTNNSLPYYYEYRTTIPINSSSTQENYDNIVRTLMTNFTSMLNNTVINNNEGLNINNNNNNNNGNSNGNDNNSNNNDNINRNDNNDNNLENNDENDGVYFLNDYNLDYTRN